MSGQKTILGFSSSKDDPPKPNEALAARTVIGREVHLPERNLGPTNDQPIDRPAIYEQTQEQPSVIPTPLPEETTVPVVRSSMRPSHTGKSRFPAIARFFGRWTTGGSFLSKSQLDANEELVPAQTKGVRTILLVSVIAVLSFLIVWFLVQFTSRPDPTAERPSIPPPRSVSEEPKALPPPAPPPPTPSPVGPAPVAPSGNLLEAEAAAPAPSPRKRRIRHKTESKPLNPDELMPLRR
jgi:hypothetical protein